MVYQVLQSLRTHMFLSQFLMLKAATDAIDLRPVRVAQKKGALLI